MISKKFFNKFLRFPIEKCVEVQQDKSTHDMLKQFSIKNVKHLVVVNSKNSPIGIIDSADLYNKLFCINDFTPSDLIDTRITIIEREDFQEFLGRLDRHLEGYLLLKEDGVITHLINMKKAYSIIDDYLAIVLETFNSLLDSTDSGIICSTDSGELAIANKSACNIFNIECDTSLITSYQDAELNDEADKIVNASEHRKNKHLLFPVNGKEKAFLVSDNKILINENLIGKISTFRDVTNQDEIANQLLQAQVQEQNMRDIIESSYDGIYITDAKGLTLTVNKSYERITGLSASTLIGKNVNDLVKENVLSVALTNDVVRTRKPVNKLQKIRNNKSVVITGSPIFGRNNRVEKVITNIRDVSDLQNMEDQVAISKRLIDLQRKDYSDILDDSNLICESLTMKDVYVTASKVAKTDANILLLGETGVGKEVLSNYIHNHSIRKDKNYVRINFGAIPANLLESELFGYEKGAFTGANPGGKIGIFEIANHGTLLLDEIGDLPLDLQVKILRVLQEGEIMRVGSNEVRKVDVRIIAATNRDLEEMVKNGTFRSDLYFRLSVVPIMIPSLKERKEDIPKLAMLFLSKLNKKYQTNKKLTAHFIDELVKYSWPGNIRELENVIERLYVVSDEEYINSFHVSHPEKPSLNDDPITVNGIIPLKDAVETVEELLIKKAMKKCKSTHKAAALLGASQPTFYRKYKKYVLEDSSESEDIDI